MMEIFRAASASNHLNIRVVALRVVRVVVGRVRDEISDLTRCMSRSTDHLLDGPRPVLELEFSGIAIFRCHVRTVDPQTAD